MYNAARANVRKYTRQILQQLAIMRSPYKKHYDELIMFHVEKVLPTN